MGDLGEVDIFASHDLPAQLPLAFLVLDKGKTPDFGEETMHPFHALHGPGFVLIEGTHKHFVEAQSIGAVIGNDVIGVDDISERLGHFLSVLAHDEAGGKVALKGFAGFNVAEVVENLVPEAGIEKVQHGVLFSADVEVDKAIAVTPVVFGFWAQEMLFVVGIAITQVIPARSGPLGHGVGLTL